MTLEEYFKKENERSGAIDHSIRATVMPDGVHFYIHPTNHSGTTIDFVVNGNELKLKTVVTF